MNARLLQTAWKCHRSLRLIQRLNFPIRTSQYHYAIAVQHPLDNATKTPAKWGISQSYLTGRRNYAAAVPAPKAKPATLDVLIGRLNANHQITGQLNHDLFVKVLDILESQPQSSDQILSPDQALFLLRGCGTLMPSKQPIVRVQLFQRLWDFLHQHAQLTVEHYRTRLQVLQHNRIALADFHAFLEEVTQLDPALAISQDIYSELLAVACSSGNMQQATDVLTEMRNKQFALTERNFNALIMGHANNNDLAGCKAVLDNMIAAGITPSTDTQTALVFSYIHNGKLTEATDILNKFHRQFNAAQIIRMLRAFLYVQEENLNLVSQLVHELPSEYVSEPEVPMSLREVCVEMLHIGKLNLVTSIISALPKPSFNENQDIDTFGIFLLQELFRAKIDAEQIIATAQLIKQSEKNTRALHIVTEIALRRNTSESFPFLEALAADEPLRPHYFWPLLMSNYKQHGEMGVMQTLRQMQTLKTSCDRETLTQYVLPHISILLERPEQTIRALDEVGVRPSLALRDVLSHLLSQHKMEAAHNLMELYPTRINVTELVPALANLAVHVRATKRYHQFAKVLAALAKKHDDRKCDWLGQLLLSMLTAQSRLRSDLKALQRFLSEMSKQTLTISPAAANVVKATLQQNFKDDVDKELSEVLKMLHQMSDHNLTLAQNVQEGSLLGNTSSFIKHPRDMTLDELECHLVELEAKQLNTRGVLRRLLQLCVRDNRLERALQIKAKCDELRVQVSPGMMASILDMYIKLKDLPNAEASLKRLQQTFPNFPVDEHKLIDYAALLVHEGQLEAGKKVLEDRAAAQKITGGDYVLKNVWNFLTNVAQLAAKTPTYTKESYLTRETFHFLQKLRYCRAHNAVLGPIVREMMLRGDIVSAVAEFRKLAEQYKHTPLQFELLSILVRLSNADVNEVTRYGEIKAEEAQQLLSEVTSVIAKVHGVLNMNSALLLAFAESGTDNQLRRLLINPEFRINQELLLKNCEHLGKEGAVTTLLRLARGARGHSRTVSEQGIYTMLLKHFAESNDYEAALDLYERLEADDELKISQEFMRHLVHLLRVNKVEIPSNIALRAQII